MNAVVIQPPSTHIKLVNVHDLTQSTNPAQVAPFGFAAGHNYGKVTFPNFHNPKNIQSFNFVSIKNEHAPYETSK